MNLHLARFANGGDGEFKTASSGRGGKSLNGYLQTVCPIGAPLKKESKAKAVTKKSK